MAAAAKAEPVAVVQFETPAGRALLLMEQLLKLRRVTKDEARLVQDLIWHTDFPDSLRLKSVD
jgi:hypothetical protein